MSLVDWQVDMSTFEFLGNFWLNYVVKLNFVAPWDT